MWICVCIYLHYVFFIHPPMNTCLVGRDWDLKRTHSFPKLRGTMIGDRKLALWFTRETLQPWALLLHCRVEAWSPEGVCGGVGRARWRRNRTVVTNTRSFNLHNTLVLISYFNKTPEAHRPGWPPKTTQDWGNKPVLGATAHNGENSEARWSQGWCAKERKTPTAVVHIPPSPPWDLLGVKWSYTKCSRLERILFQWRGLNSGSWSC